MRKVLALAMALAMLCAVLLIGCNETIPADTDPVDTSVSDTADNTTPPESEDDTTAPPETTTAPPETTTAPPETTTAPPETTTAPPETTTAPPETTTAPPETTTTPPETTTAPPETTIAPSETTIAPPVVLDIVDEASVALPDNCAEKRTLYLADTVPTLDGNITAEEWGEPDFCLSARVTFGKRTYCRDYFVGDGSSIPELEFYWRYDAENLYLAVRAREVDEYVPSAPVVPTSFSYALRADLGGQSFEVTLANGKPKSNWDGVQVAYAKVDGAHVYELSMPLEKMPQDFTKGSFTAYLEFNVGIFFKNTETGAKNSASVTTRTVPVFSESTKTHDIFIFSAETASENASDTPGTDTTPEDPSSTAVNPVTPNGDFRIVLGDPVILEQGPVGDNVWGHYQFPRLVRTVDGILYASWQYAEDSIEYKSEVNPSGKNYTFSTDDGKTWSNDVEYASVSGANLMKNGRYFVGFGGKGAYQADYIEKYEPVFTFTNVDGYFEMYFAEDIAETVDKKVTAREYDAKTGRFTTFECTINWPYAPLVLYPDGMLYPMTQMFSLGNRAVITIDGDLYLPLYFYGFDSMADSREEAMQRERPAQYAIYLFKSTDSGRTWNFISQVLTDSHIIDYAEDEGLCEPEMTVMPDGSWVMLMRTGHTNPTWLTRSADKGLTWSTPTYFDDIGVLPQLLTLECGVTLASYGRPDLRLRATSDPSGLDWENPISIELYAPTYTGLWEASCFYTDLVPIDGNTALMIYSDFQYPNQYGQGVKTIIVRTVTVEPK